MKIKLLNKIIKTNVKNNYNNFFYLKENEIHYKFIKVLLKYILCENTKNKCFLCNQVDKIICFKTNINYKKIKIILLFKYLNKIKIKIINKINLQSSFLINKKFIHIYFLTPIKFKILNNTNIEKLNIKKYSYTYKKSFNLNFKNKIINLLYYLLFRFIKKNHNKRIYFINLIYLILKYKKLLKKNPSLNINFLINFIKYKL